MDAIHQPTQKALDYLGGEHRLLIGAGRPEALTGRHFETFDPASGRRLA